MLIACFGNHMFCQLLVEHVSLTKFITSYVTIGSTIITTSSSTTDYLSIKVLVQRKFWPWLTLPPFHNYISSLKC